MKLTVHLGGQPVTVFGGTRGCTLERDDGAFLTARDPGELGRLIRALEMCRQAQQREERRIRLEEMERAAEEAGGVEERAAGLVREAEGMRP